MGNHSGGRSVVPGMLNGRYCVLVLAVTLMAAGCGSDHASARSATTTTLPDARPAFEANTSWDRAVLSVDGRTLQIGVSGAPAGDGPCDERYEHAVIETKERVTVEFRTSMNAPHSTVPVACPQVLEERTVDIRLRAPLGNRPLYDGMSPQPKPVWRLADVVDATVLPDGVTAADLTPTPAGPAPLSWSQTAEVSSGPGWDFFIDQGPVGSFARPSTAPAKVVDTTKVHADDANIYEYFNSTGREIHWTEGGLDITVRAELHTSNMRAPHSFANPGVAFIEGTLIRVANGIVVPPTLSRG